MRVFTHKRKEDFLKKKKRCNVPFELLKGPMSKIITTLKKSISGISLVKLVITMISVISGKKGNPFSLLRELYGS